MRSIVTAVLAVIFAIFNLALFFAAAVAWGWGNDIDRCSYDVIQLWKYFLIVGSPCGISSWLPYSLLTFLALIGLVVSAAYIIRPFLDKGKKSSYGPLAALLLTLLLLGLTFTLGWKGIQSYQHALAYTDDVEFHHTPNEHAHDHSNLLKHWAPGMTSGGVHRVQPRSLFSSMSAGTEPGVKDLEYPRPQSESQDSNDAAVERGTVATQAVNIHPGSVREEHGKEFFVVTNRQAPRRKVKPHWKWLAEQAAAEEKQKKEEQRGNEAAIKKRFEEEHVEAYKKLHVDGVTGAFLYHARRGNGAAKAAIVLSHLAFLFGIILALADLLLSDPDSKAKKAGGPKQPSEEIV